MVARAGQDSRFRMQRIKNIFPENHFESIFAGRLYMLAMDADHRHQARSSNENTHGEGIVYNWPYRPIVLTGNTFRFTSTA